MPTIPAQDFCAAVYCAIADHDAIPPVAEPRIAFTAQTTVNGIERVYRVEFDGVTGLRWSPTLSNGELPYAQGDRVELSAIELQGQPGTWRVWINPWYVREVEFSCLAIRLNGADVSGNGRFFRDDLPDSQPTVPPYVPGAA